MFERFTDRARRVLVLSQEEARLLDHDFIGTEHILLGLVLEGGGIGFRVLQDAGVTLDDVRREVEAAVGRGTASAPDRPPPFTPRSKKVLELSLRAALDLGHNYIGTEHLLLGLLREGEGVGPAVLARLGVSEPAATAKVVELLREATGDS